MKNRIFIYTSVALALGIVYGVSYNSTQAQPLPVEVATSVVHKPDTLANWMKNTKSESTVKYKSNHTPYQVTTFKPWRPLQVLKFEVGQPKTVENWLKDEGDYYTPIGISVTAPDIPLRTADKPFDFTINTEVKVLEAYFRALPGEGTVKVNPYRKYGYGHFDFGLNYDQSLQWKRSGKTLKTDYLLPCPGSGDWKLRVRFRASVEDFFSEKVPAPLWAFEKTFWVESRMPHDNNIEYPVELHPDWVAGLSYALTPQGPWKPIPRRGEKGFPLTWSQENALYVRPEKKYPAERWPTTVQATPKFVRGNGRTTGMSEVYGTDRPKSGIGEPSHMAVLKPSSRLLEVKPGGEFLTLKATAGNTVTAPIFVRDEHPLRSRKITNWDAVQKVFVGFKIDGTYIDTVRQMTFSKAKKLGQPVNITVQTDTTAYDRKGNGYDAIELARVSLRDSKGKTLASHPANDSGKYDFSIPKVGKYVLSVEVPGPDGKPMHRLASLRKNPQYATDLSQQVDIEITPATDDLLINYGLWTASKQVDVWERTVTVSNRGQSPATLSLAIVPLAGFRPNPRVSWLATTPVPNPKINTGQSFQTTQYYRMISPIPAGASRQTAVYEVAATAREDDGGTR